MLSTASPGPALQDTACVPTPCSDARGEEMPQQRQGNTQLCFQTVQEHGFIIGSFNLSLLLHLLYNCLAPRRRQAAPRVRPASPGQDTVGNSRVGRSILKLQWSVCWPFSQALTQPLQNPTPQNPVSFREGSSKLAVVQPLITHPPAAVLIHIG